MADWPCLLWAETRCQHPTCRQPEAVARRTDPNTSWEAAASVQRIRQTQQAVLDLLDAYGPSSDEELARAAADLGLKQSPSGLRTRRRELVDLGLVHDTGKRRLTQANRRTIVWGRTT